MNSPKESGKSRIWHDARQINVPALEVVPAVRKVLSTT